MIDPAARRLTEALRLLDAALAEAIPSQAAFNRAFRVWKEAWNWRTKPVRRRAQQYVKLHAIANGFQRTRHGWQR